ncbi:uncharacterized protein LOC131160227 isoform X2 [Malania oleifera]|uniref:uncharacterized protein LOC131160227 isoform X2 n=1 Tax=Malania oleifera TaxID=397392 RepID=UPI0025ADC79F|nr:uncharacterized protein LOC131160227 isoform X2 [Malania oleifera]
MLILKCGESMVLSAALPFGLLATEMEGALSHMYPFSSVRHSRFRHLRNKPELSSDQPPLLPPSILLRAVGSAETRQASPKPSKFTKRARQRFTALSTSNTGSRNSSTRTHELNLEVSPHRAVSAVRLMRIELGGAYADLLNDTGKGSGHDEMAYVERTIGFRTRDLYDRDLRLVTVIVGGTIRWRRYLDHLIVSLCHDENTFRSMEPLLLQILRIGCYEIVKLDVPPYAAVDENVRLAKAALRPGAGNMVNGILRKLVLLKENDSLPLPKVEGNDRAQARALATLYSHPVWMVRRWTKYLGQEEAIKLMMWNNSDPYFSLRANSGKDFRTADLIVQLKDLKVPHEISLYLNDFVRIRTGMQNVIQAGLLKEGLCAVQDESAGLVVSVLDPQPGESIIDCCAAPGGKTLFMASLMRGQGMVSAIDINKGRLRILKETALLHNVDNVITTVHADLRIFAEKNKVKSDKVLLDAPCSGLGVLSKEFCIDPVGKYVPPEFVTEHGFYFSNPLKHSLDGAFAARLVRSSEAAY